MNLPLKDSEAASVGHAEELSAIHAALVALRRGDPAAKLPIQGSPQFSKVADVFNDLVEQNVAMAMAMWLSLCYHWRSFLSAQVATTRKPRPR